VVLDERKYEWLPNAATVPDWSSAQLGSENLSAASVRRSVCFPARVLFSRETFEDSGLTFPVSN
jgi:hypothetical protein